MSTQGTPAQSSATERKVVGRPFEKGQSGNPGGRPKAVQAVVELARQHTTDAISALADIVSNTDQPAAARVAAAQALLDRGWGKAPQHVTVSGDETPTSDLTEDELIARLTAKRRRRSDEDAVH